MKYLVRDTEINKMEEIIVEAERFIEKAEAYRGRLKIDAWATDGCKESAAMKRASMDLTRALVEVRK